MRLQTLAVALIAAFLLSLPAPAQVRGQRKSAARHTSVETANIPAPEDVLGFRPGDDRKLASWQSVVEYFRKLDAASNRVKFAELGKSTMGAPFVMATISAPENLAHLEEYKKIQSLLADPRKLGRNADQKAAGLIARGKTIVLITCGIHSTEVGSYLSSLLIAHRLASSDEPQIQEILKNTIILLVPSLNPDGVDIVKNWYDKTLGTPYEGSDPPELYHKYTGHDNNRDWYAFTQVETQITVDKIHNVWHPQIVHDIHQQGAFGSRLFLPPYMQPVEPNVPKQIVEGYTELGSYIAREMRAEGFQGITTDSTYDAWSPSRAYSHYHGGVRMLSETASCKLATPLKVKFDELQPREGYDPRKEAPNFGPVWRGGEWHLRDITNYMTTAAFLLLKHASQNRTQWLQRFYEIGKDAVQPGGPGELYAFIVPPEMNYSLLIDILVRCGVVVDEAAPFRVDGVSYPKGTSVIRLAQPYGDMAKALLRTQIYPDLRNGSGHPIAPYDVTAHALPLLMGVKVNTVFHSFQFSKPKPERLGGGGCAVPFPERVAIYKSHVPAIDEGWTRWAIENQFWWGRTNDSWCGPHAVALEDARVKESNLGDNFDVLIIPDQPPRTILGGHRSGTMPPEYTGGLGEKGVKAVREFVEQGGTLVCLNRASDFAIEQFKLPLRDVVLDLPRADFYVPGSILRIELDTSDPIAKGMPRESIAWAEDSPVFEVTSGAGVSPATAAHQSNTGKMPVPQVHVIAWYPPDKDPLLSGWLLGGERIRGKAALVEVTMGKGRIILFGFRPQYRAQSLATYPLFFNAIAYKGN